MTTYVDYKQTMEQSLEYFQGNKIAAKVFVDKYALRDAQGRFLEATPRDMHKRLAREFARIESKYPNPLSEEEVFGFLVAIASRTVFFARLSICVERGSILP